MRLIALTALLLPSVLFVASCSGSTSASDGPASGRGGGRGGRGGDGGAPVPVSIAKVTEKSVPIEVTTIGSAEAFSTVDIRSQVTGQLLSVEFAEGDWSSRFERALEVANTITVTSDHHARDSIAPFEYANQVLTGMGRLRAGQLETETQGLAVIQPNTEVVPGGAASVLAMWQTLDFKITYVPLTGHDPPVATSTEIVIAPAPRAATSVNPHGQAHVIRSLLFADVVGYTLLSEDHIPNYVSGFLGAVAELNRRTEHTFEHIETSGDGLYAVFTDAVTAGLYAVELSEMVKSTDWEQHGLPANFSIRVALHCGPVYRGRDPITGAAIYTGPHVSRAARIEPVTPGGQVYASSAFAAVAAASGDDRLDMRYIGRLPLAKSYGSLGLYHVLARR